MLGDGVDQKRAVEHAAVPVAIVNGADDPFVRLSYLAGLSYARFGTVAAMSIDGAGHAPFWETPGIFNPLFHRFVRAVLAREFEPPRAKGNRRGAA